TNENRSKLIKNINSELYGGIFQTNTHTDSHYTHRHTQPGHIRVRMDRGMDRTGLSVSVAYRSSVKWRSARSLAVNKSDAPYAESSNAGPRTWSTY
ncbi:hypothetical protein KGM_204073B, partial [Danaus plexippus plexippus]